MAVLTATVVVECLWQNYNWHLSVIHVFSRKTPCVSLYVCADFILHHQTCCMMSIVVFVVCTQSNTVKRPCNTSANLPTFYVPIAPSVPRLYNYPHYCFLLGHTHTARHILKSKHTHMHKTFAQLSVCLLYKFSDKQTNQSKCEKYKLII